MKVYIFLIDFPMTARKKSKLIYIFRLILQKKTRPLRVQITSRFDVLYQTTKKKVDCVFSRSRFNHTVYYTNEMYIKLQICEFSKLLN